MQINSVVHFIAFILSIVACYFAGLGTISSAMITSIEARHKRPILKGIGTTFVCLGLTLLSLYSLLFLAGY